MAPEFVEPEADLAGNVTVSITRVLAADGAAGGACGIASFRVAVVSAEGLKAKEPCVEHPASSVRAADAAALRYVKMYLSFEGEDIQGTKRKTARIKKKEMKGAGGGSVAFAEAFEYNVAGGCAPRPSAHRA